MIGDALCAVQTTALTIAANGGKKFTAAIDGRCMILQRMAAGSVRASLARKHPKTGYKADDFGPSPYRLGSAVF